MTITVRPLETQDKERWLDLFDQYIEFYEANVPRDVIALTWQRLVSQSDGMMGFSAVDQSGAIVGIAAIVLHRSTWSASSYCYLEDLFVDPSRRGAGIGRALIEAVYAEADRREQAGRTGRPPRPMKPRGASTTTLAISRPSSSISAEAASLRLLPIQVLRCLNGA